MPLRLRCNARPPAFSCDPSPMPSTSRSPPFPGLFCRDQGASFPDPHPPVRSPNIRSPAAPSLNGSTPPVTWSHNMPRTAPPRPFNQLSTPVSLLAYRHLLHPTYCFFCHVPSTLVPILLVCPVRPDCCQTCMKQQQQQPGAAIKWHAFSAGQLPLSGGAARAGRPLQQPWRPAPRQAQCAAAPAAGPPATSCRRPLLQPAAASLNSSTAAAR